MNKNNFKGITLMSLVVTIIVLLILSGISINTILGDNSIIEKSIIAKAKNKTESKREECELEKLNDMLNGKTEFPKVDIGKVSEENSTINGKLPNAYNPIIPKGYIPINTDTSVWIGENNLINEEDLNRGLVITDNKIDGNEWVWVPVPNPSDYYVKKDVVIKQNGVEIITKNYTKSKIIKEQIRTSPNDLNGFKEPALISYDSNINNIKTAGFSNYNEMSQSLILDYNNMINSLEKYKGFYIGRYELSQFGEKREKENLVNINWYEAYNKTKHLNLNDSTETRMIWGINWDIACDWISKKGDCKDILNSETWGNFKNAKYPANKGNYVSGERKPTGSNENWKANNIYDMAGNSSEWTQEAEVNKRVDRGCNILYTGKETPVIYKAQFPPTDIYDRFTTRAIMYIKYQ